MAEGLRNDCERLGYPYAMYSRTKRFRSAVEASLHHPDIALRAVEEHGRILFLDAECRILRPIPADWQAPLISIRSPKRPFYIEYNSGTMLLDRNCRPWLEAWSRVVARWQLSQLGDDEYIHWPGDICDEIALHAALAVCEVHPQTVELEYVDRSSMAPISRGYWSTEGTVIQHPTQHHWPEVNDTLESKKLFWQNYSGDPNHVAWRFEQKEGKSYLDGWVFDFSQGIYAPEAYWADHPRSWIADSVQLTSGQR